MSKHTKFVVCFDMNPETNNHTVMNCRGRNSIKYYRELTKANRNESKVTHVSATVSLGKKR